jgi:elongation factor P
MADVVSTNQFKNGMHIEVEGQVWRIVEFQHVKPGKGGAFVRTKLKGLDTGSVVDKTFRAGEKFSRVHTEVKNVQYLYDSGDEVVFMDEESYEQFSVTATEPGVKGDTVSNVTKPATLETGAVVQVPLFVNVGDKLKVDPREKRYISRA